MEKIRFKIKYRGKYSDEAIVEGKTVSACREKAFKVMKKNGWEYEYCHTEEIE